MGFDTPSKEPEVVAEELDEVGYFGQVDEEEENPKQGEVASGSGGPEASPAEEAPNPEGSVPSKGNDERGEEGVIDGRKVRKHKGSTRPPGISPELWVVSTPKQNKRDNRDQRKEHRGCPSANSSDG